MKNHLYQTCIMFFCLVFLVGGCASHAQKTPTLTEEPVLPTKTPTEITNQKTPTAVSTITNTTTHSPAATLTPTTTPTNTLIPTNTPIPTETLTPLPPTWTPLPTLNAENARKLLDDLLENNAGCRLPCFWSITPGKTTWQEAINFLETFTMILGINDTSKELRYTYFQIPFPKDMGTISHTYVFKLGIVFEIRAYNGDLAPAFFLPEFLKTYGQPGEILIRTFREEEMNSRPFLLDLFYPDQGILMEYSGGNVQDLGDQLKNCMEGMNSPFIYLWSPDQKMTFDEAKKKFLDTKSLPEPIPLKEATGMDVKTFFESFENSGSVCIETLKELWP